MNDPSTLPETHATIVARAAEEAHALAVPGHIFTHRWLEEHLALGRAPTLYADAASWELLKMRRVDAWISVMLHTYAIPIQNVRSRGYIVIPPNKLAQERSRQFDASLKKAVSKEADMLVHATQEGASYDQIRQRHDLLSRIGIIEQAWRHARPRPPRPSSPPPIALPKPLNS